MALTRSSGGVGRVLGSRVPGTTPFLATAIVPGIEAFNSNQFHQGYSAGPRMRLTYRGESGYGVELSYFNVFPRSTAAAIGPDSPANWLVMKAPGGFWQTQDFPYQAMSWGTSTNLFNAEVNGRLDVSRRFTILAGLRWLQLNDRLQGTLIPADQSADTWKITCPGCNLLQVTPGGPVGTLPPFWNTGTTNNLLGVQFGIDGQILEAGRLSLCGRAAIGLFDNFAQQSTGVSIRKSVYPTKATASGAAFVSEAGLQVRYRATDALSLKAGYAVLWLAGVALAPGQIDKTYAAAADIRALGVNRGSNVVFHGATVGLEYSF